MATWPSIQEPSYPIDEEIYKPQVRTEFESGAVQSRARVTAGKERWTLQWPGMPEADYQTLMAFFETNQGDTFTWTHPVTSTAYTARFSDDRLASTVRRPGYRTVMVKLEEA